MTKLLARAKHRFFSMKMKNRFIISFTALCLATVFLTGGILSRRYLQDMTQSTFALFEQTSVYLSEKIDHLISGVDAITKTALYSSHMQTALKEKTAFSQDDIKQVYWTASMVGEKQTNNLVILMYDNDGRIMVSSTAIGNAYILRQDFSQLQQKAAVYNGQAVFIPMTDSQGKFSCMIVRQINSVTDYEAIGLAAIAVPNQMLDSACGIAEESNHARILLLNRENELFYDSAAAEGSLGEEALTEILGQDDPANGTFETQQYLGYSRLVAGMDYRVVIFAERKAVLGELWRTMRLLLLVLTLVTAAAILLVVLLSSSLTKPLRKFILLMEKVQGGDLTVRFHPEYRDEIGVMGTNFDLMLERTQEMLAHVQEIQQEKQQVELDALRAQINPHFMYNTLETFRMIAVERDDFELADLLCSFGKMMRYNISHMNERTTVEREMKYLQYYVLLQNSRYGGRIVLTSEIQPGLERQQLLKLLIQPVVENAISHGMDRNLSERFSIRVRVTREQTRCVIEVSDAGTGMTQEQLAQLQRDLQSSYLQTQHTKSIGLRNINERIVLNYGAEYGVQVKSTPQTGTTVSIVVPYQMAEVE